MKYKVYYTNFQYYSGKEFDTLQDAIKHGKEKGFEFSVHYNGTVICGYSVFGGIRYFVEVER